MIDINTADSIFLEAKWRFEEIIFNEHKIGFESLWISEQYTVGDIFEINKSKGERINPIAPIRRAGSGYDFFDYTFFIKTKEQSYPIPFFSIHFNRDFNGIFYWKFRLECLIGENDKGEQKYLIKEVFILEEYDKEHCFVRAFQKLFFAEKEHIQITRTDERTIF